MNNKIAIGTSGLDCAQQVSHNQVLSELLKKIKAVDFHALVGIKPDEKLTNSQLLIAIIEQMLDLATAHSWGICRKHDYIYVYNGAYWTYIDVDELKDFLGDTAEIMGVDHFKAKYYGFQNQLFNQFMALAKLPKSDYPEELVLINLKNGTFEITPNGNSLRQFNRADFITYQLPFDYAPNATAPQFMQYLDHVLPDKKRQDVLAEYLGYVFVRNSTLKLEKTLLLYGTGANGKSVFYEIVRRLLGVHNTSEYSLQSLTNEHGYHRAMIGNKLVNYASEINGRLEASTFKQLVSGEPVEARLPYREPFILDQYARLIFNCNELPRDVEQTEGFFRRFLIIPFDKTIPENEQDKELAKKIISSELSGVFNWVLQGLDRLLKNKQFTNCEAAVLACKQYQLESDSVKMFLHERGYVRSTTGYISLQILYTTYKEFCYSDGYKPVNSRKFSRRLESSGIHIIRRNNGRIVFVTESWNAEENDLA